MYYPYHYQTAYTCLTGSGLHGQTVASIEDVDAQWSLKRTCPEVLNSVSRADHSKRQGMSKSQASSFQSNTSINGTGQLSQNVSWNVITTPNQFVVSTPSSMAGPSSDPIRAPVNTSSFPVASSSTRTKSFRKKSWGADDDELSTQTATRSVVFFDKFTIIDNRLIRFALSLAFDQLSALHPNTDAPFENAVDVVNRLLPYHIFLHPRESLDPVEGIHKGKRKITSHDLANEIKGMMDFSLHKYPVSIVASETEFALECFKRQKRLEDRFRRARLKSGTVSWIILQLNFRYDVD